MALHRSRRSRLVVRIFAGGVGTLILGCAQPEADTGAPAAPPADPAAAAEAPTSDLGYTNITPHQMAEVLTSEEYVVINVHIPYEGDIPGTDVSIPFDEIEANLDQLPADKNAGLLLYCRSGRMSRIAAEKLVSLGYTNLLHLDGGMLAWTAADYPLEGAGAPR